MSMWPENAILQTYTGSCHCGDIAYEFTYPVLDASTPVISCGCSVCRRNGYLMIHMPQDNFAFTSGSGYKFNSKAFEHRFCPKCGTSIGVMGRGRTAVNVRTLDGVDLQKLTLKKVQWE